ncbi:MAG TPA: glycerol kinase GlpK [Candidatus Limiplasma sp.]|nr:glycerol kinase GlpK [Candidatus Limiplasma sp.]HPS81555.1 glycerol kinase GlpK [Candidatus Limiplasma sp.]
MQRYVIAIDQSTSASKGFLLDSRGGIVRRCLKPHRQDYPKPGYVEHDAEEIWQNVRECVAEMASGLEPAQIAAIGLSNQRETTVLWDRATGMPLCPAVVWQDVRGEALCAALSDHAAAVTEKTGLTLSAYYPAAKAAAVFQERPELSRLAHEGMLCMGTVDSYLVYRLTGGRVFRTDVSNASRTELCDIRALRWDPALCALFGIPIGCLPEITPSDGDFGQTACEGLPAGIPITGVMGDSHASLFGQGCLNSGMAKATFGTGSSVMMNVGPAVIPSHNGLSASVGFGYRGATCYVLEGNVTCSADTLCWLRDGTGMVPEIEAVEPLAASVPSTEGVYLVPAFSGLGAPYFDSRARAAFIGMNRGTRRAHMVRAALESIAYQDADIIAAMRRDTGSAVSELRVDGGPTRNHLLMQFLTDLLGCGVRLSAQGELSALGAGYMAGLTAGLYENLETIPARQETGTAYRPAMETAARDALLAGWRDAVNRCRTT